MTTALEFRIDQVVSSSDLSDEDFRCMSGIITTAFRSKFTHVGLNDDQALALNQAHIRDDVRDTKNVYFVARRTTDGTIVGVCELLLPNATAKPASTSVESDQGVKQFKKTLGFWQRLRVGKLDMVMSNDQEKELAQGEAYVKAIAVAAECRGLGLGSKLLDKAHTLAAGQGYTKMSLHVAGMNQRAKQLYEKVGYVEDAAKSVMGTGERAYCRFCGRRRVLLPHKSPVMKPERNTHRLLWLLCR